MNSSMIMFRAGRKGGTLAGKNAGCVAGLARFLMDADNFEMPDWGSGSGEFIGVFEVTWDGTFGEYVRITNDAMDFTGVGRVDMGGGHIKCDWFTVGINVEIKKVGEIKLADVREVLKRDSNTESFDFAGTVDGAKAITKVLKKEGLVS